MSSIEMKNFSNMFCHLISSLRDSDFICREFMEDAVNIKTSFQKMLSPQSSNDADLPMDDDESKKLQNENEEMKNLLADYHRGVQLMMDAYRERVNKTLLAEEQEKAKAAGAKNESEYFDSELIETILRQSGEIYQLHNTMRRSTTVDANADNLIIEQIAYLRKENEVLRELYDIAKRFGTAQQSLRFNELSQREIGVQTVNFEPEPNGSKCWENYEKWKEAKSSGSSDDYDEETEDDSESDDITVVEFCVDIKDEATDADKKHVSAQAYTF